MPNNPNRPVAQRFWFTPRLRKRLSTEITIILLLKLIVLWVLWAYCFAHPIAKSLRKPLIAQKLFSSDNIIGKSYDQP